MIYVTQNPACDKILQSIPTCSLVFLAQKECSVLFLRHSFEQLIHCWVKQPVT